MLNHNGIKRYIGLGILLAILIYEVSVWYPLYVYQINGVNYFPEWGLFWGKLLVEPQVIFFRNWGPHTTWCAFVILAVVLLTLAQKLKVLPFKLEPIDAPWQYVAIAIPLTLACQAIIGVGSSLNWFWNPTINAPNDMFSWLAHFCAALGIALWIACFDVEGVMGLPNRWKWIFTLLLLLIPALWWENVEGYDLLAHGGIPTASFYTNLKDSLADLFADFAGVVFALSLWDRIWDWVHGE